MCGGKLQHSGIQTTAFTFIYGFPRPLVSQRRLPAFPCTVFNVCVPYEQTRVPRAAHRHLVLCTLPLRFGQVTVYQTGTALTEKYPKEQDLSQRTSSEHQVVSGNSTLKGRLFQEAKDRSTGDNALRVGFFFFFFGFKSSLACPFVKAADGGGNGDAPAFRYTQLEEPEAASAVSPSAFTASRRLALAAPGD